MGYNLEYWGGIRYLCEMSKCPFHCKDIMGECIPIHATFFDWVETTGIGEYIPYATCEGMDYWEFVSIVKSVVSDPEILTEIKEKYCNDLGGNTAP